MKFQIKLLSLVLLVILTTGCATNISPQQLATVKTVGVISTFPEYPNYTTVGTTILNNENDKIKDEQFSKLLMNTVLEYMNKKGYEAKSIEEWERTSYDMILELTPRDVYLTPQSFGFGVHKRSIFGIAQQANTYVALNIESYIHDEKICYDCYLGRLEPIPIDKMPYAWNDLSSENKDIIINLLNKNIKDTLTELLIKIGF